MSYIGNQPTTTAFLTDQFSGNGSTTAFTMSVAPAATSSILVAISGVVQDPSAYSVINTTLTFSAAPPTGTGNISVRYLGIPASGVTTTAYRTVTEFTATSGQTTFSPPSYTVNFLNVYRNGVRLASTDYTASNGTTVVLTTGATTGDTVTTESYYVSSVLNALPLTGGTISGNTAFQAGVTVSGNVGIGTSSPSTKLQVVGTIAVGDGSNGQIRLTSNSTINYFDSLNNAASAWQPTLARATTFDWYSSASGTPSTGMRLDSSGNLGVGTTSPYAKIQATGTIKVATGNSQGILALGEANGTTVNCGIWRGAANAPTSDGNYLNFGGYDGLVFATGNAAIGSQTERARIDSSGNVFIGTTSVINSGFVSILCDANTRTPISIKSSASAATTYLMRFVNNSGTDIGAVQINGTNNGVNYTTASDYRLKENIQPMTGALAKVAALNPCTYTWKDCGASGQGFIAHELQEVVPECVSGEKDAVETYIDDEGNEQTTPKYQGIDTSHLVATLTAAIKEQQALITQLQADVAALKG